MACPKCKDKKETQLHWCCVECGDGCHCYASKPKRKTKKR